MHTDSAVGPPLILLVASRSSVEVVRWAGLLRGGPFRVVIFVSDLMQRCPELDNHKRVFNGSETQRIGSGEIAFYSSAASESIAAPDESSLTTAIRTLRPDVVHTLDLQYGGALNLEARRQSASPFPRWIASCRGSDLHLYRRVATYVSAIRDVLQNVDVLHCECARDGVIAAELGFRGMSFPVVPASGGILPEMFSATEDLIPPSHRKLLVVDGQHGTEGRGQHAILALHRIAPLLKGYSVRVTHGDAALRDMVAAVAEEDGLDIALQDESDDAHEFASLMRARAVLRCAVSGDISSTFIEGMFAGAFPIQSDSISGCEWIQQGVSGFNVPTHDIGAFADAIKKALTDDQLVDNAAVINREIATKRWSTDIMRPLVVGAYQDVLDGRLNAL